MAAPAAPSNLDASVSGPTQVHLSWTDNSADEVGFIVQRAEGAGAFSDLGTAEADAGEFYDDTAVAGIAYHYRVCAINDADERSTFTNTADVTIAVPAAPTNLIATLVGSSGFSLQWTDNSNNEEGFTLDIKRGAGDWDFLDVAGADQTGSTFSDFDAGDYTFRVSASNPAGYSAYTNEATLTIPPVGSPWAFGFL